MENITNPALTTAKRSKPMLHRYAGGALVCGSRAEWIEAEELDALVAELVKYGNVCGECFA